MELDFWGVFWLIFAVFQFAAYLMVVFTITGDLVRDHETSGLLKGVWIFLLIAVPWVTALVYFVTRGGGMAERQRVAIERAEQAQREYIQRVAAPAAGPTAAEQIASAKALLDSGAINAQEFEALKAKALA
jgi:hypothetical protein